MKNKISAVIITFNEEVNIARCLDSLKDVADEIIVVDSLSTDKTPQICAEYGVRFVSQAWLGYGQQKNFAAELAEYPWILSLDADEALSPELRQSILEFKQADNPADVYQINRLNNYCGKWIKHCGWYPDRNIRLWRKHQAHWTTPRAHEKIQPVDGAKSAALNGDILHYTYYTIEEHIAVANKYTTLVAEEYLARGKKSTWVKRYLSPPFGFLRDYLLKRGFLDGYYGLVICVVNSFMTFIKHSKLKQLQEAKREQD